MDKPFKKPRAKVAVDETESQRFSRLATNRVNSAIKRVLLIGNLGNRSQYEYTDAQVSKLFTALDNAVMNAKAKFSARSSEQERITI